MRARWRRVSRSYSGRWPGALRYEASYLFAWWKRTCGACRATRLETVWFGKLDWKWRATFAVPAGGSARLLALRLPGVGQNEAPVCGEREAGEREVRGKQFRYGLSLERRHARARRRLLAEG
jgi:hypothetical protein